MTPSEYFFNIDDSVSIYTHQKTLYWKANALKDTIEYSIAIIEREYHIELRDITFSVLVGLLARLTVQIDCIKILSEQKEQCEFLKNLLKDFDSYKNKSDPAIAEKLRENKNLEELFAFNALPMRNLQKYPFKKIMGLVKAVRRNSALFKEERISVH